MAPLICLIGPTGSGKSTQARILSQQKGMKYLSTGDLSRSSDDPVIKERLKKGELAPPGSIQELLLNAIKRVPFDVPIALEGFPRLLKEAEWLTAVSSQLDRPIKRVISMRISDAAVMRRLAGRGRFDDDKADRKLEIYRSNITEIENYLRRQGLLAEVNADQNEESVTRNIETLI